MYPDAPYVPVKDYVQTHVPVLPPSLVRTPVRVGPRNVSRRVPGRTTDMSRPGPHAEWLEEVEAPVPEPRVPLPTPATGETSAPSTSRLLSTHTLGSGTKVYTLIPIVTGTPTVHPESDKPTPPVPNTSTRILPFPVHESS